MPCSASTSTGSLRVGRKAREPARILQTEVQAPPADPQQRCKACKTCKVSKPLAGFSTHHGSKDGHRVHCRECLLTGRYRPTPETPAQRKRRSERQSRPSWQRSHARALRKYNNRNPVKIAALRALNAAINGGRLQKASRCQVADCNSEKAIEAHHWSYEPEHWLDVLWCCAAHHRQGHAQGFIIPAQGIPAHYGTIPEAAPGEVAALRVAQSDAGKGSVRIQAREASQ